MTWGAVDGVSEGSGVPVTVGSPWGDSTDVTCETAGVGTDGIGVSDGVGDATSPSETRIETTKCFKNPNIEQ